jgi:hypothetical protein
MCVFELIHRKSTHDINRLSPENFHAAVFFSCLDAISGVNFSQLPRVTDPTQRRKGPSGPARVEPGVNRPYRPLKPVQADARERPRPSGQGRPGIAGSMQADRGLSLCSWPRGLRALRRPCPATGVERCRCPRVAGTPRVSSRPEAKPGRMPLGVVSSAKASGCGVIPAMQRPRLSTWRLYSRLFAKDCLSVFRGTPRFDAPNGSRSECERGPWPMAAGPRCQ